MNKNGTYFKIGLFVLFCIAVLIAGLLYISADTISGDTILVETYIDESVQGLSIGSPVYYRGVNIGQIKEITFVPREYVIDPQSKEYQHFSRYVMVIMALKPSAFPGMLEDPQAFVEMIQQQIQAGLRFKLSYQGITGITYMEADYIDPERNVPLNVPWIPKGIYVPSTPSLIRSFTQALEDIFLRLENMNIEGVLVKMEDTLDSMNQAIKDAKITEVRESFVSLTNEISQSNKQLLPLLQKVQDLPDDIEVAIKQFTTTMQHLEQLINENEPNLDKILADLMTLSQNFLHLSETLKQDPAQIFLSTPPERSELVQ